MIGGRRPTTGQGSQLSANTEALSIRAKRRKGRGWWLLALVLVLALAGGGAGWWFGIGPGAHLAVPSGIGGPSADPNSIHDPALARTALTNVGLVVGDDEHANAKDVTQGDVIATDPAGGTSVLKGSTVRLIISDGPAMAAAPSGLIGQVWNPADPSLAQFVVQGDPVKQFDATVPGGAVISISTAKDATSTTDGSAIPAGTPVQAGLLLPEGTPLSVVLSVGPLPVVPPGTTQDAAKAQLQQALLVVAPDLVRQNDDSVPKDAVISYKTTTDPVRVGDTVQLVVSDGPQLFAVPDVTGQTINQATTTLQGDGFTVADPGVLPAFRDAYRVRATSPAAGEMKPKGATVTITSFGP